MAETLGLIHKAMEAHGKKRYEMPAKIGIHPYEDVFYHAMPAYVPDSLACGVKWIECYPRNPKDFGLPQTTGLLILNDIMTGIPVAVMDSAWITAMRTPALTSLAAAALHPDAKTFGMFGCGVQGTGHVRYIVKALKELEKIYIYDVRSENMDRLIQEVEGEVSVPIVKGCEPGRIGGQLRGYEFGYDYPQGSVESRKERVGKEGTDHHPLRPEYLLGSRDMPHGG